MNNIPSRVRACVLFVIQRSAHLTLLGVTSRLNHLIQYLVWESYGGGGIIDWIDVGVLAYGADTRGKPVVRSLLSSCAGQHGLVSVSDLAKSVRRYTERKTHVWDDESGEVTEEVIDVPIWIDSGDPKVGSPLCQALRAAHDALSTWVAANPDNYPPILINVTDGTVDDGDPAIEAESLGQLATVDGPPLLLIHHFPRNNTGDPIRYPVSPMELPPCASHELYHLASALPDPHQMQRQIYAKRYSSFGDVVDMIDNPWKVGSKGYACNVWLHLEDLFGFQYRLYTDD